MDAAFERRCGWAEPLQVGLRELWGRDGSGRVCSTDRRPSRWYGRLDARRTCGLDGLEWTGAMDREPLDLGCLGVGSVCRRAGLWVAPHILVQCHASATATLKKVSFFNPLKKV